MQTSFFGLVDGLMRLYDRRVGRGTGSTPIKQHSNENVAETHAVEQRKDYRINVSSIQSTVAGVFSTLLGYVLRAEGRQGKVMFYFENTPDPQDVKAIAEAEGVKIENLKKLKELEKNGRHRQRDVYGCRGEVQIREKQTLGGNASFWRHGCSAPTIV